MTVTQIPLQKDKMTDTVAPNEPGVERLNVDSYLPMLYPLIPAPPAAAS